MENPTYIGRFAPSPTGLLHIGSLLTAVASYLDAKAHHGRWLVRMEDLDPPREMAGAASHILHTLAAFGLEWDGEVVYQSQRHTLYHTAFTQLQHQQLIYPCYCSRKTWQQAAHMGVDGWVYNGNCRNLASPTPHTKPPAWRIRVPHHTIAFHDAIIGDYAQNLAHDIGDFVLLRNNFIILNKFPTGSGCRRCRTRHHPHCARTRLTGFHTTPNLPTTMLTRPHTPLCPFTPIG